MVCLEFVIFLDFDPKIQNFNFSKIITYKIRNFHVIEKNMVKCDLDTYTQHAYKISRQYLCFWLCNRQKNR